MVAVRAISCLAIVLTQILVLRQNLQIPRNVQPAPIFAPQGFDVVNVVLNPGELLAEHRLRVDVRHLFDLDRSEPRRRSPEFAGVAQSRLGAVSCWMVLYPLAAIFASLFAVLFVIQSAGFSNPINVFCFVFPSRLSSAHYAHASVG